MDATAFLADLHRHVAQHRAVHHPLLRYLEHEADREDFLRFGQQHVHLVGRFTRYLEELLIRAPGSQDKLWIAKVLVDEYGEGSDGHDHATLYRRWLAGLVPHAPISVEACPTVQQFIGGHLRQIASQPFLYGLGMVGPGHEWAIPTMFEPVIRGLRRLGYSDDEMAYFPLHCEQDADHGEWLEEALARHAGDPLAQRYIRDGMNESLRLRASLWDGVLARIQVAAGSTSGLRMDGSSELVGA